MKRPSRRLSAEEAALWARLAQTITPLDGRKVAAPVIEAAPVAPPMPAAKGKRRPPPPPIPAPTAAAARPPEPRALDRHGLDASWDRRLARGLAAPDFTLDLHGASLEAAHSRLDHGLTLAMAQGARLVLLVTGRSRPHDGPAGRGERRGAIRAKVFDWLEAGPHGSRIAAIRPAHPRHGGAGAVYIVLRRRG
ncbi:MAG: Smr/MutS family protein [Novosphingobium sp.]|nr:Smr/MutS family protein [Novosphingobium sp.]